MKIIIDKAIPFIKGVLEPYAEVIYADGEAFDATTVAEAQALIIRTRTRCNRALLEGSKVEIIATATIGFDHIDLDYCARRGIKVVTAAGCNARGVLQWVASVLVMLSQKQGFEPHQRTIGIVGVGNVGKLVKSYAESWGFKVICCDPPRQEREKLDFVSLEQLIPQADILTLHTPLNSTTRGLINSANLVHLHHGATIINASRGEVAQTEALLREDLTCAIDVWEREPNIDKRLLAKAIVATPHIAGYSKQGKANATSMVVEAIARHFALPIVGWYPAGIKKSLAQPIDWQTLKQTICAYCDIEQQSAGLKNGGEFEQLRNNYNYREEYF